jgi:hypothetical protein
LYFSLLWIKEWISHLITHNFIIKLKCS